MSPQKQIITPEHFRVAPEVLGLPLASPSRRAMAMALDLILVAILVKAGGGAFLGVAAAFLLFRASASNQRSGFVRGSVRLTLRITAAIVLFAVIVSGWRSLDRRARSLIGKDERSAATDTSARNDADELNLSIPPRQLAKLGGAILQLRRSDDSATVANAATKVLETAKMGGATTAELYGSREDLLDFMGDNADSSEIRAVDAAIATVAGSKPDSIATAEDSLRRQITKLETSVGRLEARNERLEDELEDAKKAHGIRSFIAGAADDLGVGFGWSAVYFTAFLALWRGQTPGKRFAKVRVLRLDGKPMGWWLSFERFGGYAASLSVGLLGFAQILWDRNRQGLHDKACETVVVRDSAQAFSRS